MLVLPMRSVWPSFACAAAAMPMTPPAPGRFSTIIAWPSCGAIASASTRAEPSAGPPGGNGTMMRTVRTGHASAALPMRGPPVNNETGGERAESPAA